MDRCFSWCGILLATSCKHVDFAYFPFDFLSGFQEDAEFVTDFDFLGIDFGAAFTFEDAFDFDSIGSGAFEYNNISCEFSVERILWRRPCNRREHQLNRVFLRRMRRSHVGIGISHVLG